ncbi:MAG: hypothetical protein IPN43_11140 [Chitinophagaceae bacterium]|nr:hypothetical protein [Chitinophagaceae bacterium]
MHTRFTLFKRKYNFSLTRLVYHCFIKSFDLNDQSIVILAKDKDNLNVRSSNLKRASRSEKQKRIFETFRRELLSIPNESRKRAIANSRLTNNKTVTQYTKAGNKIKTYPSIMTASKALGISNSHISNTARGTGYSAGGFIWRYGVAPKIDMTSVQKAIVEKKKRNKEAFGKKVTQYQMDGKRVAVYPTINDAAKATGIGHSLISNVLHKKNSSAGNFYWQEGDGDSKIDLSLHKYGEVLRARNRQKPIEQYSRVGEYLQTFNSIKEAALHLGIHTTSVIGALKGKQQTAGGFKWKYVLNG